MPEVFDVLVVGAGPGGSNAAAAALDAGLTVAQVERYAFPRVKPCAGGLTNRAQLSLSADLRPVVQRVFRGFEFNVFGRRVNRYSHPRPLLTTVHRPDFDNLLVARNVTSPHFRFYHEERLVNVAWNREFVVQTDKRELRARQLVGADGAYSVVNKAFRIAAPRGFATAIEVTVDCDDRERLPCFDFGAVPRGYGWVFPKDGCCTVGLYTLSRNLKDLRSRLPAYARARNLPDAATPPRMYAYQFPYGGYRLRCPDVPVYLVGDAGGFGDALTGEGIYHALESGRLAGQTAADVAAGRGSHRRYYRRLWQSVLPDTFATYHLAAGFYQDVDRAIKWLERPFVWRPFVQGYADGATFAQCVFKGAWFLARSAKAARRPAP